MQIAGGIGIGLVAGWVAARLMLRAPWNVRVWVLLGLAALSLIVLQLAARPALIGFVGGLLLGALMGRAWVRTLEARYGRLE